MPEHDIARLLSLNIGITLSVLLAVAVVVWAIGREVRQAAHESREGIREIAQIQREVAFMIRRQYGDIDRDLQEIQELLGGQ
jgi:Na+-transporting methylmalonyl-CoA/oxaloacetate decarboxylase gamma subunit